MHAEHCELLPMEHAVEIPLRPAAGMGAVAGVAPASADLWAIADYDNVYLVSRSGQLRRVRPSRDFAPLEGIDGWSRWNPTGLCFLPDGRLAVANYKANDCLLMRIEGERLAVDEILSTDETLGPEGVAASRDGRWLVLANLDGNSLVGYRRSGSSWRRAWKREVRWAHGVAVAGGRVFATSLADREILMLDLETGHLVRRSGHFGWHTDRGDYLWPTSLTLIPGGPLVITDPHAGSISLVDPDTFRPIRCLGVNGAGRRRFNMPYGAAWTGHDLVVASTFQRRLLVLDPDLSSVEYVYSDHPAWQEEPDPGDACQLDPEEWDGYLWKRGPHVTLLGHSYRLGYSRLERCGTLRRHSLVWPEGWNLLDLGRNYHFINAFRTAAGLLLFSPQCTRAMHVVERDGRTHLLSVDLPLDSWSRGPVLWTPEGPLSTDRISADALARVAAVERERHPSGLLPLQALLRHWDIRPHLVPQAEPRFREHFPSREGAHFADAYLRWNGARTGSGEALAAAERCLAAARARRESAIDEILLVAMLSGTSPDL